VPCTGKLVDDEEHIAHFIQSLFSFFSYLCTHHHKLIDMKKLSSILFCLAFGIFANSYARVLAAVKEDSICK